MVRQSHATASGGTFFVIQSFLSVFSSTRCMENGHFKNILTHGPVIGQAKQVAHSVLLRSPVKVTALPAEKIPQG